MIDTYACGHQEKRVGGICVDVRHLDKKCSYCEAVARMYPDVILRHSNEYRGIPRPVHMCFTRVKLCNGLTQWECECWVRGTVVSASVYGDTPVEAAHTMRRARREQRMMAASPPRA